MNPRRPSVVGIGGSGRPGSTTERALHLALEGAAEGGASVRLFGGAFLGDLPWFRPAGPVPARVVEFLDAVALADGLILASPSYHGGVAAVVKNALDHLEALREAPRPYLDGRAVGCVVTAAGGQAGGVTLVAMRSIVHALRGWPTPLGATIDTTGIDTTGPPAADAVGRQAARLRAVGCQVATFAQHARVDAEVVR